MPANTRLLRSALLPLATAAFTVGPMMVAPSAEAAKSVVRAEPQTMLTARQKAPKVDKGVARIMAIMKAQQGDPYSYGSAGPNAFDCSGLVYFASHAAGFKGVPRTSGAQAGYMRRISRSAMKPGDFVFFSNGGGVYHVGMFMGGNKILHAPYSGTRVRIDNIWTGSWFGGTLRK